MKLLFCFCSTIIAVVISGCSGSQVPQESFAIMSQNQSIGANNPESPNYVIKQRDQIQVSFRQYPEFDTTVTVTESGSIYLRLVGEMQAIGLSKEQLSKDIHSKYSGYVKGEFTVDVSIVNRVVQNITVLGAVSHQGVYPAPPDGSILAAVALAGGTTDESDLRHVKIFRSNDLGHPIEVDLSLTLNVAENNDQPLPTIGPGDIVYVPKLENFVRDLSEFLRDSFILFSVLNLF
jgi:polysaccharide biosynthesis/export protein